MTEFSSNFNPTVYVLNASAFEDKDLYNKAYDISDLSRKAKTDSLRYEKDKRLSLGAGILLSFALFKAGITDYKLTFGQNGKPYLENGNAFFNLSHSGDMAACVIAPYEVGCDIELVGTPDIRIAKRFFSQEEYNCIVSSCDATERFYRYWTLKESFVKATGLGFKIPLNSFSIALNDGITVTQNIDSKDYYFCEIAEIPNYRLAVCGTEDCGNIAFSVKTPYEIISEMNI